MSNPGFEETFHTYYPPPESKVGNYEVSLNAVHSDLGKWAGLKPSRKRFTGRAQD